MNHYIKQLVNTLFETNNKNLDKAKKKKNDEFYTLKETCYLEFPKYSKFFNNKVIYCNCDDYKISEIYKYFKDNFHKLNLKLLYSSWYNSQGNPNYVIYDGLNEIIKDKETIDDGSFDSVSSIELLKKSDIVVTNVPFSNLLPIKFINLMKQYNKKFITTVPWTILFKLINELNSGEIRISTKLNYFMSPNGDKIRSNTSWITNLPIIKEIKSVPMNFIQQYFTFDKYKITGIDKQPGKFDRLFILYK